MTKSPWGASGTYCTYRTAFETPHPAWRHSTISTFQIEQTRHLRAKYDKRPRFSACSFLTAFVVLICYKPHSDTIVTWLKISPNDLENVLKWMSNHELLWLAWSCLEIDQFCTVTYKTTAYIGSIDASSSSAKVIRLLMNFIFRS